MSSDNLIHKDSVNVIYAWLAEERGSSFEVQLLDDSGTKTVDFRTTFKVDDFGSNYTISNPATGFAIYAMMRGSPYPVQVVNKAYEHMMSFFETQARNKQKSLNTNQESTNQESTTDQKLIFINLNKDKLIRITIPEDMFSWLQGWGVYYRVNGVIIQATDGPTKYDGHKLSLSAADSILKSEGCFRSDTDKISVAMECMKKMFYKGINVAI